MARKRVKKSKEKKEDVTAEKSKKSQAEEQNRIIKSILIIIGFIAAGFFLFVFVSNSLNSFEYNGVDFNVVKLCDAGPPCITTYRTSLPVKVDGEDIYLSVKNKTNDYNFYIRNDPRILEADFNGALNFRDIMVFNSTGDFICDGKGGIAGANLVLLYDILGIQVIKDENATCDPLDRYMIVNLKPGGETRVEQVGPSCYDIYINNCEVLEGTEKFMIETFVEVNKILRNESS